eukprot:13484739-Alexandrium_andersonii.AAC.1
MPLGRGRGARRRAALDARHGVNAVDATEVPPALARSPLCLAGRCETTKVALPRRLCDSRVTALLWGTRPSHAAPADPVRVAADG